MRVLISMVLYVLEKIKKRKKSPRCVIRNSTELKLKQGYPHTTRIFASIRHTYDDIFSRGMKEKWEDSRCFMLKILLAFLRDVKKGQKNKKNKKISVFFSFLDYLIFYIRVMSCIFFHVSHTWRNLKNFFIQDLRRENLLKKFSVLSLDHGKKNIFEFR